MPDTIETGPRATQESDSLANSFLLPPRDHVHMRPHKIGGTIIIIVTLPEETGILK